MKKASWWDQFKFNTFRPAIYYFRNQADIIKYFHDQRDIVGKHFIIRQPKRIVIKCTGLFKGKWPEWVQL